MMPMPDMKPETTTWGVYATKRPIRETPSRTCSSPPSTTTVSASARVFAWLVTMTAMATVMGAVGPDICDRVPPNIEANRPVAMAP